MTQQHIQWLETDWSRQIGKFLRQHPEVGDVYSDEERRAWDDSRVDILTEKLAIEVDRAHKWAEAVGQAFLYGIQHNRQRGIILLSDSFEEDQKFIYRCQTVCEAADIHLWLVDVTRAELYVYGDRFDLASPDIHAMGQPRRSLKGL